MWQHFIVSVAALFLLTHRFVVRDFAESRVLSTSDRLSKLNRYKIDRNFWS